ncbi:MAG TPA: phosphotransferase [Candidatus Binatia bacterium]|nr:phosphotransferase [Candidatus Binatia bacterium]
MHVPENVEGITAEWVDEALRAGGATDLPPVTAVRTRTIGAQRGFLSLTVQIDIDYATAPPDGAPGSLVAKLEPAEGGFRDAERRFGAFDREVRFYREVAGRVPLRLPRIYWADASGDGKVLLMEDLTAYRALDQVHGMRHEQVLFTAREVAKLHAAFARPGALDGLDWLPLHDHFFDEGFADHWPAFARCYELRIGRDAVRLGERVVRKIGWLEERIAARPVTLIHGDLRADNLLVGDGEPCSEVVVLDWQLTNRSLAAIDIARMLGGSEPPAERRGHQLEVFAAWHEGLLRAGRTDYAFDEALTDFRLAVLYCLCIPVFSFTICGPEPEGRTARLLDAIAERLYASAIELDAGELLP